jgi:uncharacterized protein YkwD
MVVVLLGVLATGCGTSPGPAPGLEGWQSAMLDQVNAHRAAAGAAPLSWCPTVAVAAQGHSADQAAHQVVSHTGSDGSTSSVRFTRAGYLGWTRTGENVAGGYGSVDAVMAGWMGSSGHRTNILDARFTHFGAGLADSSAGTPYWTQGFGTGGSC